MNLFPHHVAQGLIDGAVSGNRIHPLEVLGNDYEAIVTASTSSTAVSGVCGAFVGDVQLLRFQHAQFLFQLFYS